MRDVLQDAFALAAELIDLEEASPVREYLGPEELEGELDLGLRREGADLESVLASLRPLFAATPRLASRRFFNQLYAGRDVAATVAEMLSALWNTPMPTFKAAGAQLLVEREVQRHMAAKVGFEDGEGTFTPGGSLSNLVAIVLARNEAIAGAREDGLPAGDFRVYTSAASHYSIAKGVSLAGLGRSCLRQVPVDADGRMDVAALARMISDDERDGAVPVMINATAGTTVLGAFDALREIARVASDHGVWLHVDGAWGGSVLLSESHRHLLDGSELVDSFTWDAHKMMIMPVNCSLLLVRQRGLLEKHLGESAGYLYQTHDAYNPAQRSIQCGRRNDALKLWAAWRHHGDAGYARRIDHLFRLAERAVEIIEADPELRLVRRPPSLNVCFEVAGRSSAEISDLLARESRAVVSHVPLDGRRVIRLICVNPDLDEADIEVFFREVKAVAAGIAAAEPAGGGA